jgi:hypothetical protein
MNQLNRNDMQQHVTIVGWLFIIGHAFFIAIGGFVFVLLASIGAFVRDPEVLPILTIVGTWVALFMTVLALPGLLAGYGLLKRTNWGRVLGIIVAIFGLINFPIGTAIGVYALFVLLQNAATDYFAAPSDASSAANLTEKPA